MAGLWAEQMIFLVQASQAKEQVVSAGRFDGTVTKGIDGESGGGDLGQQRTYVPDKSADLVNAVDGPSVVVEGGQVVWQVAYLVLADIAQDAGKGCKTMAHGKEG